MRFLGFIFILAVILAGVGYYQGWFTVSTVNAGSGNEVQVGVDTGKIGDDAHAAADRLSELSAEAVEVVKSLGRKVSPEESELEGTLSTVDVASRRFTLTVGSRAIDLQVPAAVTITRDGEGVGFDQLRPATRAKCVFTTVGESRRLSRIEILR